MPRYTAMSSGGWKWRVANGWHDAFKSGAFAHFEDLLRNGTPVKDLNIKRTIEIHAGGRDFLVKTYKRRGTLHRLKAAILGSRAGRELAALVAVMERGVPTIPFVAIGERDGESCVVIEVERERERLDRVLGSSARRRALLEEYGRWARRVHDAGVAQYDFNPTNVLARRGADADLRLIDFEKVRVGRPPSPAARMRSISKMHRMIPATRADRLRFFRAYLGPEAADRAMLKRRAAEVMACVRAQRAIDARRRRDACAHEGRNFARFDTGAAWGWMRRDLVAADAIAGLVAGGAGWRRVEERRALDAWRRANGAVEGELPAAVVIAKGGARGHVVYRSGLS